MNYPKMYALLCGAVSDAIDELQNVPGAEMVAQRLENALRQAEECYIGEEDERKPSR